MTDEDVAAHERAVEQWRRARRATWLSRAIVVEMALAAFAVTASSSPS